MHPRGTCPVCGAERRPEPPRESIGGAAQPTADGRMVLARLLNGTPWREPALADPPAAGREIDLSWLKW